MRKRMISTKKENDGKGENNSPDSLNSQRTSNVVYSHTKQLRAWQLARKQIHYFLHYYSYSTSGLPVGKSPIFINHKLSNT